MAKPPEFELYDLQEDPHEFINLAGSKEHQSIFNDLKQRLSTWRKKTKDPFLNPRNLEMLKAEVDACRKDGSYEKKLLHLNYTQYFFETAH